MSWIRKNLHPAFVIFVRLTVGVFLWMSLMRVLLLFEVSAHLQDVSLGRMALALFQGARFDLLVLGFAALPLVVLVGALDLFRVRETIKAGTVRVYAMAVSGIIFVFGLTNVFTFPSQGGFLSLADLASDDDLWTAASAARPWVSLVILALLMGSIFWRQFRSPTRYEVESPRWRGLMLALLLAGLAARGSLASHHLELADSQISANAWLNQLTVNPIWAFDKELARGPL